MFHALNAEILFYSWVEVSSSKHIKKEGNDTESVG